jgi:hypothetical protein
MRYYAWQALESPPVRGPLESKRELTETRAYLDLLIREVTNRYRAGMPPGQSAADINMGRFSNWTNPERIVWNTMHPYAEFNGSLTPEMDVPGTNPAMEEYSALKVRAR